MATPTRSRLWIGRSSLLVLLTAAALTLLTPEVGLAADDDGAVDDGLTNDVVDDGDIGDSDELIEWGEDVEVWGERADGSKFVPEVLPEVDYYSRAMSVSVEETKRRFAIEDGPECLSGSLPKTWVPVSWVCGLSTSLSSGCLCWPSP